MEAFSSGVGELDNAGNFAAKVHRALVALESSKEGYAEDLDRICLAFGYGNSAELSKLKTLNNAILKKPKQMKDVSPRSSNKELPECLAFLENLLRERESLVGELQQQKARCEELEQELEQEHTENLEAQVRLSVLSDTFEAALQGKKLLVERVRRLPSDQETLASKLDEVSNPHLPAFQSQIRELESACSSVKQEEVVLVLYNKNSQGELQFHTDLKVVEFKSQLTLIARMWLCAWYYESSMVRDARIPYRNHAALDLSPWMLWLFAVFSPAGVTALEMYIGLLICEAFVQWTGCDVIVFGSNISIACAISALKTL